MIGQVIAVICDLRLHPNQQGFLAVVHQSVKVVNFPFAYQPAAMDCVKADVQDGVVLEFAYLDVQVIRVRVLKDSFFPEDDYYHVVIVYDFHYEFLTI